MSSNHIWIQTSSFSQLSVIILALVILLFAGWQMPPIGGTKNVSMQENPEGVVWRMDPPFATSNAVRQSKEALSSS